MAEVSKLLRLDLQGIPDELKAQAKSDVGDFVIESILRSVGDGKSPVENERWKNLSKDYADEFKGGDRTPTMQLFGDLLDSLTVRDAGTNAIRIGHFDTQADKADGHNQHSVKAKLWAGSREFPKRRYIPEDNQKFKGSIERGINEIIEGYKAQAREDRIAVGRISDSTEGFGETTGELISVDLEDLFSEDVINSLIADVRRRRG